MHDVDPPPGVSIIAVEIDFWNLVAFAIKAFAALVLAVALIGVPIVIASWAIVSQMD